MNRREALKGLGLTLGYTMAVPSVLGMLQSCTAEKASWNPIFLNQNQGLVLADLIDLILPATESAPGAKDVNVAEFIDLFVSKVFDSQQQDEFKAGMNGIMEELGVSVEGKVKVNKDNYIVLLDKYLKPQNDKQSKFNDKEQEVKQSLHQLRETSVWAFRNSELIGEKVLSYDPIPGAYLGCIPTSEVKNSWSL